MAVRLFVGNLPYDVTEAELRAHFAAIGPLSYLSLATDRDTGKPHGFAFVEFSARAGKFHVPDNSPLNLCSSPLKVEVQCQPQKRRN